MATNIFDTNILNILDMRGFVLFLDFELFFFFLTQ